MSEISASVEEYQETGESRCSTSPPCSDGNRERGSDERLVVSGRPKEKRRTVTRLVSGARDVGRKSVFCAGELLQEQQRALGRAHKAFHRMELELDKLCL